MKNAPNNSLKNTFFSTAVLIFMAFCAVHLTTTPTAAQINSSPAAARSGEEFTLANGETKQIKNGAEIKALRIGRKWVGDAEKIDFQFSVKYKGRTKIYAHPFSKPIYAGETQIEIVKIEVFGKEHAVFKTIEQRRAESGRTIETQRLISVRK